MGVWITCLSPAPKVMVLFKKNDVDDVETVQRTDGQSEKEREGICNSENLA